MFILTHFFFSYYISLKLSKLDVIKIFINTELLHIKYIVQSIDICQGNISSHVPSLQIVIILRQSPCVKGKKRERTKIPQENIAGN